MTTAAETVPSEDEAFGLVVHEAMYSKHVTQVKMAAALGITQGALSKKLRGHRPWTLAETVRTADVLRVDLRDLLAKMWGDPGEGQSGKLTANGASSSMAELRTFNPNMGTCPVINLDELRQRREASPARRSA